MAEEKNNGSMDDTSDFLKGVNEEDIFSVDTSSDTPKNEDKNTDDSVKTPEPSIPTETVKKTDDSLALHGDSCPPEYVKMVERINAKYAFLPTLDYDSLYKEIAELSIKSSPTPTLQVLNDELHKVQAAKDRLSEILIDVIKCYNFKNRAVDILKDAWGKFTNEKNTEGRKGDATFRLSDYLADFAEVEALFKACSHVFKNLDSLHDNLSRRITIWQLTLKLRDVGRGALPDFDYDKASEDKSELLNEITDGKGGDKEVELREF